MTTVLTLWGILATVGTVVGWVFAFQESRRANRATDMAHHDRRTLAGMKEALEVVRRKATAAETQLAALRAELAAEQDARAQVAAAWAEDGDRRLEAGRRLRDGLLALRDGLDRIIEGV